MNGKSNNKYLLVEAKGQYFNELNGETTKDHLTLSAILHIKGNKTLNINILTTLQNKRLKKLMNNGYTFETAKKKSKKDILKIFNIDEEQIKKPLHELNIIKDQELLRTSVVIQGNNNVKDLKSLIENIEKNIEENGKLKSELKEKLIKQEEKIRSQGGFEKIIKNLTKKFNRKIEVTPEKLKANKIRNKMISAGNNHSLALDDKGYLYSWGFNKRGQLGNGTKKHTDTYSLIKKIGDRKYSIVYAGDKRSYAIDEEGYLWGWGSQVKTCNSSDDVLSPMKIGSRKYNFVYANTSYTYAIDSENYLWVWGCHTENKLTPKKVTDTKYEDVTAGYFHTLAIDEEGYLWIWGKNESGQLGDGTTKDNKNKPVKLNNQKYKSIAGIQKGSAAIREDGSLYIWGNIAGENLLQPKKIGNKKYKKVVANSSVGHFLLLGDDDDAYALGNSYDFTSLLGNGTKEKNKIMKTPIKIGNKKYKSISTGKKHILALDKDDNVYIWGDPNVLNSEGDGDRILSPRRIEAGNKKFKKISTGTLISLAIDEQDNLYIWGNDKWRRGLLGHGKVGDTISTPTKIGDNKYKSISTKYNFVLALDNEGYIWSWGNNYKGKLGNGTTKDRSTPAKINNKKYKAISAGYYHSLAIDEEDYLWSWGSGILLNSTESIITVLGNNKTQSSIPIKVGDRKYKSISAGRENSFAIDTNGNLYFWGEMFPVLNIDIDPSKTKKYLYSKVDDEYRSYVTTPTQMRNPKYKYESIKVGGTYHVLGMTEDGFLTPFYYHHSKDFKRIPAPNPLTRNRYKSFSVGSAHVLAIDSNSNIHSWGEGYLGQLGIGIPSTFGYTENPKKISNKKFKAVSASSGSVWDRYSSSLAIDEEGDLYGWGFNVDNHLGLEKTNAIPMRVFFPPD